MAYAMGGMPPPGPQTNYRGHPGSAQGHGMQHGGALPQQLQMNGGGVDVLAPLSNLFAKQTKRGAAQELVGFEAKTEFRIATMENKSADIMYGIEESDPCHRLLCGNFRPWVITITAGGGPGGPVVTKHVREWRGAPAPCKICCWQEVAHQDEQGQNIGKTMEIFWCDHPQFIVLKPSGEIEYILSQPVWCCGMVDLCAEGLCRAPWYVFPPKGTHLKKEEKIGGIVKVWSGGAQEIMTDADNFEVEFPAGADAHSKARLLGSLFLINQLFFEGK